MGSTTMKPLISLLTFAIFLSFSHAKPTPTQPQPQPLESFILNETHHQNAASCSYSVSIKTSCSSTRYTRDQISLSFGDAYGNQEWIRRLETGEGKRIGVSHKANYFLLQHFHSQWYLAHSRLDYPLEVGQKLSM
ncbi:embryo-specific protein ATS3B-like [Senna tora]|uniref:Embryo-specific protein ATS3B-like n=1 Tax=Senna tora TaxID=362788 RepID=A0A834T3D2_9FABA|nr:embryo-specific protein ATS3B-like [Senna tora]